MHKWEYGLILIGLIGLILIIGFTTNSYGSSKTTKTPDGVIINSSDRILIVAPHPDDESIGAGGIISYSVKHNIPVKVVVITDGDTGEQYYPTSWMMPVGLAVERHNETIAAMNVLGLNQENILFLGYRDGSLPSLLNQNWNYNNPFNVNGTTTNINYPYPYQKNATYCGANVAANLEEIIGKFKPTIIVYTDSEDEQIDHWATNGFVEYATSQMGYNGAKYTYIVHDPPNWPSPRIYHPEYHLTPPPELTELGYKWVVFPISPYDENLKEAAIDSYKSQITSDSYIQSFIRKNEVFAVNIPINVTVSNESLNFFSNPLYPDNVVIEPKKNVKGVGSVRSRELIAVGFQIDKDNAWVSLKTKHNISSNESYEIHIMSLNNPERIDINIQNGTAYYEKSTTYSYTGEPKLQTLDNGLIIEIPSTAFNNMNSFIINADIMDGYPMVDWTGIREIRIIR